MATSRIEIDTRLGFGRGSAVREYWLERCQGFYAVRPDGRRLGRVKRVETEMEGTFLRLTGFRARTIPLSAVETVWPGASLLLVCDQQVDQPSQAETPRAQARTRPAWMDETLPWWELIGETEGSREDSIVGPNEPRSRMTGAVAAFRSMLETLVNTVAARAKRLFENLWALAQSFRRNARRASVKTLHATNRARMSARSAMRTTARRTRLRVARSLFGVAVWIGGSGECIFDTGGERQRPAADEQDTEEIG
jgi:hypothetical protein